MLVKRCDEVGPPVMGRTGESRRDGRRFEAGVRGGRGLMVSGNVDVKFFFDR